MKNNCISLYKAGKFYNAYGDDALIIHYLMQYKYLDYKKSTGFPEAALTKVINVFESNKISYKIYEKNTLLNEFNGMSKVYQNTLKEALKSYDMEIRVNRLKEKINNFDLNELEKIVEGIESGTI